MSGQNWETGNGRSHNFLPEMPGTVIFSCEFVRDLFSEL